MVPMAITFLGRGAIFFPEIFSIHFHKLPTTQPEEKKTENLQHRHWFPNEKRSEGPVKKFHTDLGSASDWLKQISLVAGPIRCTTQIRVVLLQVML